MQDFNFLVLPLTTRSLTCEDQELIDRLCKLYSDQHVHSPITRLSEFRLPERDVNLLVLLVLSGGVSRLAVQVQLLLKCPTVILAHLEDNSLPSALGVFERQLTNVRTVIYLYDRKNVDKTVQLVGKIVNACRAAYTTARGTYLILFEDNIRTEWIPLLQKFNIRLKFVRDIEYAREDYEKFVESLKSKLAELYNNLNVQGITFDCFRFLRDVKLTPCLVFAKLLAEGIPIACECDLIALFELALLKNLNVEYLRKSMIVNMLEVDESEGTVTVAHCTAPTTISDKWELDRHFESGYPHGVRAYLPKGSTCTLFRIDPLKLRAVVTRGTIVQNSGDLASLRACLTRARIRLDRKRHVKYLNLGNHHILTIGDVVEELRLALWYLGFKIRGYKVRKVMRSP